MLEDLTKASNRTVGTKQTLKSLRDGNVDTLFLARDIDDYLFKKIRDECQRFNVSIEYVDSMRQLGEACCIDVGAAAAAILKN